MPALTAERLEAVRGGVHLGREVEGGRAAHRGVAAARAAIHIVLFTFSCLFTFSLCFYLFTSADQT